MFQIHGGGSAMRERKGRMLDIADALTTPVIPSCSTVPVKLVLTTSKALLADTEGEAHLRERAVEALGATMIYLRGAAPGFPRLQTSIQQAPGSEPSTDACDNSPQGQT